MLGMEAGRRPGLLSEAEKKEADNFGPGDLDKLQDIGKCQRLEAYFRQEGFHPTADAVRKRMVELGHKDPLHDPGSDRQARDDLENFRNSLRAWTAQVRTSEQELLAQRTGAPGALNQTAPAPRPGSVVAVPAAKGQPAEAGSKQQRVQEVAADTAKDQARGGATRPAKPDSKFGGQVRSGPDYYQKWDQFAEQEVAKLQQEELSSQAAGMPAGAVPAAKPLAAAAAGAAAGTGVAAARGAAHTQQLLTENASLSLRERQWHAEQEKAKGNDCFRAKEYQEAVEKYTLALGFTPDVASLHGNRAAAYWKLKMYPEVVQDCDAALALEPHYLKALARRASARLELGYTLEALQDIEAGLELEPGNTELQGMQQRASKLLGLPAKTCIPIQEVGGEAEGDQPAAPPAGMRTRIPVVEESDSEEEAEAKLGEAGVELQEAAGPARAVAPDTAAPATTAATAAALAAGSQKEGSAAAAAQPAAAVPAPHMPTRTRTRIPVVEESDEDEDIPPMPSPSPAAASAPTGTSATSTPAAAAAAAAAPAAAAADRAAQPASKPIMLAPKEAEAAAQPQQAVASGPAPQKREGSTAATAAAAQPKATAPAPAAASEPKAAAAPAPASQPAIAAAAAAPVVEPPSVEDQVAELRAQATKLLSAGNNMRAVEAYTKALALQPDSPQLLAARSAARLKANDAKAALTDALVSLVLDHQSAEAMYARAQAKLRLGLVKAAEDDLAIARDLRGSQAVHADIQRESAKLARERARREAAKAQEQRQQHRYKGGLIIEEHSDEEEDAGAAISAAQLARMEADAVHKAMQAKKQAQVLRDQAAEAQAARQREAEEAAARQQDAAMAAARQQEAQAQAARQQEAEEAAQQLQAQRESTAAKDAAARQAAAAAAPADRVMEQPQPVQPAVAVDGAGSAADAAADRDTRAQQYKERGNELFKAGDLAGARECWQWALELAAPTAEVARMCHINLAQVALQVGDATLSLQHADAALQIEPGHRRALFRRAMALEALGRLEEALDVYRRVRTQAGLSEMLDEAIERVAATLAEQQQPGQQDSTPPSADRQQGAQASLSNEHPPTSAAAAQQPALLAELQQQQQHQHQEEQHGVHITQQQQQQQQHQEEQGARVLAADQARQEGNTLFKENRLAEALQAYTRSLEALPTAAVHANIGLVLMQQSKLQEAAAACRAALALDPTYTKATFRLAKVLCAAGQHKEALPLLKQAAAELTQLASETGTPQAHAELRTVMAELQAAAAAAEAANANGTAPAAPPAAAAPVERRKIVITETDASDESDDDQQPAAAAAAPEATATPPAAPAAPHLAPSLSARSTSSAGGSVSGSESGAGNRSNGVQRQKVAAAIASLSSKPLPPPKNATELLSGCKTMGGDLQRLSDYVQSIDPASYAGVFKQALDNACMSHMLKALAHIAQSDLSFALRALQQLSGVGRFAMVVAMLPKPDKAAVSDILSKANAAGLDTDGLHRAYHV